MDNQREVIVIRESIWESVIRDTYTGLIFAGLIGLGWWIGSGAMQWFGGIIAFLFVCARASQISKGQVCTAEEARKRLADRPAPHTR